MTRLVYAWSLNRRFEWSFRFDMESSVLVVEGDGVARVWVAGGRVLEELRAA